MRKVVVDGVTFLATSVEVVHNPFNMTTKTTDETTIAKWKLTPQEEIPPKHPANKHDVLSLRTADTSALPDPKPDLGPAYFLYGCLVSVHWLDTDEKFEAKAYRDSFTTTERIWEYGS